MPDEDKNFGGSLVLDFRKWWRHVQSWGRKDGQGRESGFKGTGRGRAGYGKQRVLISLSPLPRPPHPPWRQEKRFWMIQLLFIPLLHFLITGPHLPESQPRIPHLLNTHIN